MPYENEFQLAKFVPFDHVAYQNKVFLVTDMRFNSGENRFEYQLAHKIWVVESALFLVDEESLLTNA